jgi:hypothetical protein
MSIFLGGDMDIGELREKLKGVTDPRRPWGNLRHKLEDILVIGLAAPQGESIYFPNRTERRKSGLTDVLKIFILVLTCDRQDFI